MPQPGGGTLRQFLAAQADDDGWAAGELFAPIGGCLVVAPDSTGDQPRVGGEILVGANVDQGRRVRRADQFGKLVWRYRGVDGHGCALVKTGRDTWACRLVGGSQNPHG